MKKLWYDNQWIANCNCNDPSSWNVMFGENFVEAVLCLYGIYNDRYEDVRKYLLSKTILKIYRK